MDRRRRGTVLVLAGVALLVGTVAIGVVTAPSLSVAGDGDANRETLVGSQSTEGGWHEGGAVMAVAGDAERWREDSAVNYFDVDQLEDGRVLAAFSHGGYRTDCGPYEPPCHKTGYRIIDPDADGGHRVVEEWSFPVSSAANSEVHDADVLPGGEVLLADMDRERLLTVSDGEVTWEWSARQRYVAPADPTREDWLHMNDVVAINETHYLTSVRNANQLLVIERGAGVVEVINRGGGNPAEDCPELAAEGRSEGRCGDPAVLNHQHNPQWLGEGAVLVADSDNDRAVELHRDEATGRWEPVWAVDTAAGVGLHWPRDADRLANGNTLITDTFNSRVVEVAPNGTAVWSLELYNLPYEADRLPGDEPVGAPAYGGEGDVVEPGGGEIPVVTTATEALKGEVPILPFWFGEIHFLGILAALALACGGAAEHGIAWYDDRTTDGGSAAE